MKLHQLLAFQKDLRKRVQAVMTDIHRRIKTPQLVQGITRRYEPIGDNSESMPTEASPLTLRTEEAIEIFRDAWSEEVDHMFRMDVSNLKATADIEHNGDIIAHGVPATHLLYLEKMVEHVRTFIDNLVELPPGHDWKWDEDLGCFKTPEKLTYRTEKIQEPVVLLQPTDKHPGQAQLISRDRNIGKYFTTAFHGGITATRKRELLKQCAEVADAIKTAREKANQVEVPDASIASVLFSRVFEAS